MPLTSHADSLALAHLSQRRSLPLASRVAVKAAWLIAIWTHRRRTRVALRDLPADLLNDIGLSPRDAFLEAHKPFWRP